MPKKKTSPSKTNKPKHPGGRPTIFTQELANRICHLIYTHSWGIKRLCEFYEDIPDRTTIREWRVHNKEFSAQYVLAKTTQIDFLAEDIIDISDCCAADPGSVAKARLMSDNRKWYVSKLAPKIYGDKLQIDQKEDENNDLRDQIKELRKELNKKNRRDY